MCGGRVSHLSNATTILVGDVVDYVEGENRHLRRSRNRLTGAVCYRSSSCQIQDIRAGFWCVADSVLVGHLQPGGPNSVKLSDVVGCLNDRCATYAQQCQKVQTFR